MIKLFHSSRTRSVRVLWLLEELGLPYELKTMSFTQEALKSPEYLKVNPAGKIPAIQDGDLTMYESGAIVEYIVEKYGQGKLAPAPGSPDRGLYLQWLHFAEATALPPVGDIARHMMFLPEADRIPAVVADARVRVAGILAAMEKELAGKQYLLGASFSAADVMMGYSFTLMKWFGLVTDAYPNVTAYLGRLEQRPAYQKAISA